jgi:hypothetical protein
VRELARPLVARVAEPDGLRDPLDRGERAGEEVPALAGSGAGRSAGSKLTVTTWNSLPTSKDSVFSEPSSPFSTSVQSIGQL